MTTKAPFPTITKLWHNDTYDAIDPTRPEVSAAGKVVLITGGGSGIGAAIAKAFAAAGTKKLALVGRRQAVLDITADAITKAYPDVKVVTPAADITNESQINSAFATAAKELGPIDIFVSNSGFLPTPASIMEANPADWWKAFEVNVYGQLLSARAFLKHAGQSPKLIALTSNIVTLPPIPVGTSGYAASKLGATAFFNYLAFENQDKGLEVFQVHPGVVESDMNIKSTLQALDKAELPAHFIVWLASPEAEFLKEKIVWANFDVPELIAAKEKIVNSKVLEIELQGMSFADWSPEQAFA